MVLRFPVAFLLPDRRPSQFIPPTISTYYTHTYSYRKASAVAGPYFRLSRPLPPLQSISHIVLSARVAAINRPFCPHHGADIIGVYMRRSTTPTVDTNITTDPSNNIIIIVNRVDGFCCRSIHLFDQDFSQLFVPMTRLL